MAGLSGWPRGPRDGWGVRWPGGWLGGAPTERMAGLCGAGGMAGLCADRGLPTCPAMGRLPATPGGVVARAGVFPTVRIARAATSAN